MFVSAHVMVAWLAQLVISFHTNHKVLGSCPGGSEISTFAELSV